MKRLLAAAAGAAALVTLAGCGGPPPYKAPAVPLPPAYKEGLPQAFKESKDWKVAKPADALNRGAWWEMFSDPVLTELEQQVAASNQNLKSAEARFRQARAFTREQRSAQFPTLTGGGTITRDRVSINKPMLPSSAQHTANDFVLPMDVSYEVDLWGRIRSLVASAAENAQATAADLESVRLSLQAELALDYFNLRSVDEESRIVNAAVEAYTKAFDLTRRRFEGGVANRLEVSQAETQLQATQAQAIDLRERRAQYEHAIAVLAGKPPESFSLPAAQGLASPPVVPPGVPSTLLERRPDIAATERRVAAANAQIGFARAAFYPQLLLSATGGLEGSSFANWISWPSRLWAIGPSAVQTLFDAGRRRAGVEEAVANYDAGVAEYRQSVLSAFQQVEDNLASLSVLEEEANRQQDAVAAARRTEDLAMNRYKGGLVTYLEVATAQTTALQNERVAVDIARRRMDSTVLLIKALGGGWDARSLPQPSQLMASH